MMIVNALPTNSPIPTTLIHFKAFPSPVPSRERTDLKMSGR